VAHSITLIATSLNWINLPAKPVEAVIALSIVFLANELASKKEQVTIQSDKKLWLVVFIFGLLHGFGFAGALSSIGLPVTDVPLALLSFNIGVELGQILFVLVSLLVLGIIKKIIPRKKIEKIASYSIGICASYWLLARVF